MTDYTDLTTEDNEMFCRASKSTSIIYKNYIYIFGGMDKDGNYIDDLLQYDINLRAFTNIKLKTKPCARACHAACLLGDFMYVYGGTDGNHTLDDLWRFDLLHGNFERIIYETGRYRAPTLEQHCMGQLSPTELLIFGGYSGQNRLSSNYYIYSIHTNTIQAVPLNPQCPEPTIGATLTYQDQKLYLFGGYGLKGYVNELWEIGTSRRWQQVRIQKAQPLGRSDHCFVPIGRDLMILYGGRNGQSNNQVLNDMWALNAKELHWRRLAEPKCGGRANCAVQAWKSKNGNFRLLLIGGISRAGQATNISQLLIQNYNEAVKSDDFALESVFVPSTNNINITDLSSNKIDTKFAAKESPISYEGNGGDQFMDRSITIQRKRLQDLGLSLSGVQPAEAAQSTVLNLKNPQNIMIQQAGLPRQTPPQSQHTQQNILNNHLLKQIQERLDTVIYQVNLQQDVFNDKIKSIQDIQINQQQQFVIQQEHIQRQLQQNQQQKETAVEHTITGRTQVQNYDEEKIVYSLQRQFDKAKQEIQIGLNKQFTDGLTQTQQELIALTKKLLNDQCSQISNETASLQAQLQGIAGRLENFEQFSHGQFVRESQIATFQPQLEKFGENIQTINERLHNMQVLVESQERQGAMLANQMAECCASGSLRAGIQASIDETVLSLKNKVLKLEGTILDLQQENIQLQKNTNSFDIQNTSGAGNVTVMNVTDEVFERKFIEIAQKNNVVMSKSDVKDLIRDQLKEFKTQLDSELQTRVENQLLTLENKISSKMLQDTHQIQNKFEDHATTIQQQLKKINDKIDQTAGSEEFTKRIEQQQIELKQLIQNQTNQVKLLNSEIMQIREEMVQRSLALKTSQLTASTVNSQQLQKSTEKITQELSQRFSNVLSQGPSQQSNTENKLAISQTNDQNDKSGQILQSHGSLDVSMAPVRKSVRFQDEGGSAEQTPKDSATIGNAIQKSGEINNSASLKKSTELEASSGLRAASLVGGSMSLPEQDRIEKSLAASAAYQKQELITKRQIRSATIEQRLFFDETHIGEEKVKHLAADVINSQIAFIDQNQCKVFDVSTNEVDVAKPFKQLQLNNSVSSMDYLNGNCYIGEVTGLIKQLNIDGGAESLFVASPGVVTTIKAFGDESDQFVVCGDEDGQVGLWEPLRGQFRQLCKHESSVKHLSVSSLFCISSDQNNEIIVHDIVQGTKIVSTQLTIQVKCIDLVKDTVLIGSNGQVKVFKISQKKGEILETITLQTRKNITRCFLDQQKAVLFTEDGFVQYWDLSTKDLIQQMQMTQGTSIDEACIMHNGICCAVEASCVNGVWYKD